MNCTQHPLCFYSTILIIFMLCPTEAQNIFNMDEPLPTLTVLPSDNQPDLSSLRSAIPGEPIVDYPIFSNIPQTSFNCTDKVDNGYYADLETRCQGFHVCSEIVPGQFLRYSFLCPNGTLFQQQFNICQWWYYVDCNQSPQFYPQQEGQKSYKSRSEMMEGNGVYKKIRTKQPDNFGSRRTRGKVSDEIQQNRRGSVKRGKRQRNKNHHHRNGKSMAEITEKTVKELEEELLEALYYFV